VLIRVGVAPCDTCGREIMTDQKHGGWYFGAGCADIYGDGCHGQPDTETVREEEIDIY
jgi:hypothetical protein